MNSNGKNAQYRRRDKFKGCRDQPIVDQIVNNNNTKAANKRKENKKIKEQIPGIHETQEQPQPQPQPEVHESVWQAIDDVVKQAAEMKQSADNLMLDKTSKKVDAALASLSSAQKQVAKAEELKKKELENKDKPPKKERQPPYKEILVGVVEVDGKKKDKYDVQKTATSPVITKYKAHKPVGLNDEQLTLIEDRIKELKETVKAMNDDFNDTQFKKAVSTVLKTGKAKEEQPETTEAKPTSASSEEEQLNW